MWMVNIENLRAVVAKGLKEYVGIPFIRSNQNAEPPGYPYGTYTITTVSTENNGTYGEWEDGIARKGVNTVWSITIRSRDSVESVMLANKAREWLDYVGTAHLNSNDVIVQAVTSITNRDNVLAVEYEHANGFDCFFWMYDEIDISNVPVIETMVINGDITVQPKDYAAIIAELNARLDAYYTDFEEIRDAIASKGVEITEETPTSEFADIISRMTGDGITDVELSETSTNPVANKTITTALANIDHSNVVNMESEDLHPIRSVEGLEDALNGKIEDVHAISNLEIEEIINSFVEGE